jgi:hypothetical protein
MPAESERMAHYMQMAHAVKHGHRLKGIDPETMDDLRKTAKSMTNKQLSDFSHVAKGPKGKKG